MDYESKLFQLFLMPGMVKSAREDLIFYHAIFCWENVEEVIGREKAELKEEEDLRLRRLLRGRINSRKTKRR